MDISWFWWYYLWGKDPSLNVFEKYIFFCFRHEALDFFCIMHYILCMFNDFLKMHKTCSDMIYKGGANMPHPGAYEHTEYPIPNRAKILLCSSGFVTYFMLIIWCSLWYVCIKYCVLVCEFTYDKCIILSHVSWPFLREYGHFSLITNLQGNISLSKSMMGSIFWSGLIFWSLDPCQWFLTYRSSNPVCFGGNIKCHPLWPYWPPNSTTKRGAEFTINIIGHFFLCSTQRIVFNVNIDRLEEYHELINIQYWLT